jgi:hypothetical protein
MYLVIESMDGINTQKTFHKTLEKRYGITAFFIFETMSHGELIAPPGDGSGIVKK